jgi:eukaryotic-like serine/threonine-protein kinase
MISQERWQQIKAIFISAQQCTPAERSAMLDKVCGDDDSLRQEVESLLANDETGGNFLAAPAYEVMAGGLVDDETDLAAGQEIGPYTILSALGAGGMGQVYLAQDSRLPRKVALKLLFADVARDDRRVQRFEQEAQAASRLNHPNVCMILEIGTAQDGRRFIAMEHIDGLTLRDLMERRRLLPAEALDVGIQVATALAVAHATDIVHRDIKPENIMVRRDGFVKVLDFGIAKLNESPSRQGDARKSSTAKLSTEPGMLMGTVRYMSPEQLREIPVDERTDIWSLGVVLYEMVTGTSPFTAATNNDTVALILSKQETDLKFGDEVPAEFRALIRKTLSKDRAERYQTITELVADLKTVRRHFRGEIEWTPKLPAEKTVNLNAAGTKRIRVGPNEATKLVRLRSQAMSTADFLLSGLKEHKTTAVFTGLVTVFAVLLILPYLPRLSSWSNRPGNIAQSPPAQALDLSPLTNSGTSVCAAISPNGKLVAHVQKLNGMQQLIVTRLVSTRHLLIVAPDNVEYKGVTFSPDSNYLYFSNARPGQESGTLYRVALPGGSPKRIKYWVDSPISFSPSGDSFAFVRSDIAAGEYVLIVATDGMPERVIAQRGNGDRLSVDGPAWSIDGKSIVCGAGWWDTGYHMKLIEVSLADGAETTVGDQTWFSVSQVAWRGDGSELIFSAREQPMAPSQLWRVSYPSGQPVNVTTDPADYRSVSISHDTNMIVSVQSRRVTQIWTMASDDARFGKPVIQGVGLGFGLSWTAKGQIVFSSMAGKHLNISLIDPDGSNQKNLTVNAGDNYTPATSPDGRFIVFSSNRTGSFNIWRMNAEDGSDLKQLTFSDANSYPSCSMDSQWVYYDQQSGFKTTVLKVPLEGGDPIRLTDEYARMPVVSPDNQYLACRYFVDKTRKGIAIISVQGGLPVKLLKTIPVKLFQRIQWISNGHALSYIKTTNGVSNIWSYNLDDGSENQLTNFETDQIFAYAWSPDNKKLAYERGSEINDVMIIGNEN